MPNAVARKIWSTGTGSGYLPPSTCGITTGARTSTIHMRAPAGSAVRFSHVTTIARWLAGESQRLAQEIEAFALEQVPDDLLARHPLCLGHRGDSSRRRLGGLDESDRRVAELLSGSSDALLHHATGRDLFQYVGGFRLGSSRLSMNWPAAESGRPRVKQPSNPKQWATQP
jgi:hypothetical protein